MPVPTPGPLALQAIVSGPDGNKIIVYLHCITDGIDSAGPGTIDCFSVSGGLNISFVTLNVYGWVGSGTGLFHVNVGDWPAVAALINAAIPSLVITTAITDSNNFPISGPGLNGGSSGYGT